MFTDVVVLIMLQWVALFRISFLGGIVGPDFGYFSNASKIFLIVKSQHLCKARALFWGTGVVITDVGKLHLDFVLGTIKILSGNVQGKVLEGLNNCQKL